MEKVLANGGYYMNKLTKILLAPVAGVLITVSAGVMVNADETTTTTVPVTDSTTTITQTPATTTTTTSGAATTTTPTTTPASQPVKSGSQQLVATPAPVEQEVVYAIRGLNMYKSPNFSKNSMVAIYPKQKRINRPMFKLVDYAKSSTGVLRLKVVDINKTSRTYNKTGYITADDRYTASAYYQSIPKNRKIKVIAPKGIRAYNSEFLEGKSKHYKKGAKLKVVRVMKSNLTTRFVLSNGMYVTGNKTLVSF